MKKVCVLTLGCPKNIVDSEKIISSLLDTFSFTENVNDADIILLNTCGFIQSAIDETIEYINKLEKLKNIKSSLNIIIYGCAVTRLINERVNLKNEFKFVSDFVPLANKNDILSIITKHCQIPKQSIKNDKLLQNKTLTMTNKNQKHNKSIKNINIISSNYAYLKISDGCNRMCSFCTIPSIKGKYKSTSKHLLIEEAEQLVDNGIKEIILIGQETTNYGKDKQTSLYQLLIDLSNIKELKWIRIMYTHPMSFDWKILDLMNKKENICHYIDIPLQHIDDNILTAMNRQFLAGYSKILIKKIRHIVPDIHIRSTFITGFPGETINQHKKLLKFINDIKLERVGVFKYSRELNTPAYTLEKQISEKVKQKRFDELMFAQQQVSLENNRKLIGVNIKVLIEDDYDDKYYIGRTEYDAPDIDNCVYVEKKNNIKIGTFVYVNIFNAKEYWLYGR